MSDRALRDLARLHGVQLSHTDGLRRRHRASGASLVAVLRALGAGLDGPSGAADALRSERARRARRKLEPVTVAWDGEGAASVRVPAPELDRTRGCTLRLEDGEELRWSAPPSGPRADQGDRDTVLANLPIPDRLPPGYHRLAVEDAGEALVVSAPRSAHVEPGRRWSLFAPTYALRTERDAGVGDLTDLEALAAWVEDLGGDLVTTLPPLAAFLDEPFEPSPYAPVSRLFWNELYVDPTRAPELAHSPEARDLLAAWARGADALRGSEVVDHRKAMALKRPVLEALARAADDHAAPRPFAEAGADLEAYARFRAACERSRAGWRGWSRPGRIREEDLDPESVRYHRYVQGLAERQLAHLGERAGLQLDLPLGVHPEGFDTWSEPDAFAPGVSAGAPPDAFSSEGQDWGFPPLHPERIREQGHRYLIGSVRTLLRHARGLRVDHVMGLHRLFWIPEGMPAAQGVYVGYPHEELYAVLSLESHRRGAVLVGEDLGTVHPQVRAGLRRHGLLRMVVTQTEVVPDRDRPVRPVPRAAQASLNTHDMFPFASFWEGRDVDRRVRLGVLPEDRGEEHRTVRARVRAILAAHLRAQGWLEGGREEPSAEEALDAALRRLAGSEAAIVVVALEDLWLETEPQNVPGTTTEHPNWSRRLRYTLQEARRLRPVLDRLEELDRLRGGEGS